MVFVGISWVAASTVMVGAVGCSGCSGIAAGAVGGAGDSFGAGGGGGGLAFGSAFLLGAFGTVSLISDTCRLGVGAVILGEVKGSSLIGVTASIFASKESEGLLAGAIIVRAKRKRKY
jgi:hypothetical protein